MMRPVIRILCAALLGLAVLFAPGPQAAQAAPVAASSLAASVDAPSMIEQTYYYYRRHHYGYHYRPYYRHHYYRPYYRHHYYRHHRHYW
jgi:hypothetical protein